MALPFSDNKRFCREKHYLLKCFSLCNPLMRMSQEEQTSCKSIQKKSVSDPSMNSDSFFDDFTSENSPSDNISFSTFVSASEAELEDKNQQECDTEKYEGFSEDFKSTSFSSSENMSSLICRPPSAIPLTGRPTRKNEMSMLTEENAVVNTGFTTGNRNAISVKKGNLIKVAKEFGEKELLGDVKRRRGNINSGEITNKKDQDFLREYKQHKCNTSSSSKKKAELQQARLLGPKQGNERVYLERAKQIFLSVRGCFEKADKRWFYEQFKWSWLSFFLRGQIKQGIEDGISEQIKLRKQKEYSVLRRIVEGDDVATRHMVLLVVQVLDNRIEVFDGFYSVFCTLDNKLREKVECQKIRPGCRIRTFGAQHLLESPICIFSLKQSALHLSYNGVRVASSKKKLGYQKKASFLARISEISEDGGPVSCIDIEATNILEEKLLLKCGNYKKVIEHDKIEQEIEKMDKIARSCDLKISKEEVVARRYIKLVAKDSSGECLLTWWSPENVVPKNRYRFMYLKAVKSKQGLHLSTTNRTYFKKLE